MNPTLRFDPLEQVILFGGAPLLVATARWLASEAVPTRVYTSPRHMAEVLDAAGTTLAQALAPLGLPVVVTEDINREPSLAGAVTPATLGLGMGEAWSFDAARIALFGGRLLDFMGIPHPRYRGGAHYTWMLLRGEREGGCNLQVINTDMVQGEFDSGAIVKTRRYAFPAAARTPADYFAAAVPQEVAFIREFLAEARAGQAFELRPPDEARSLMLPRLHTLTHGWIDWAWDGAAVERFVCAFDDPYKGASTLVDGRRVHLKAARLDATEAPFHPFQAGLVTRVFAGEVCVATRGGYLVVRSVRDAGGADVVPSLRPGMRLHTPPETLAAARVATVSYAAAPPAPAPPAPTPPTPPATPAPARAIEPGEWLRGEKVSLRLVTLADCTERYVAWLADPEVHRYLETRWAPQDLAAVRAFVADMLASPANYLFAIVENRGGAHVGNIKLGPVNARHAFADVSYFIGERAAWGRGYATEAIALATAFGFARLGLHRVQAGLYAGNVGSGRALARAGFALEGRFAAQLRGPGGWEDHVWYAKLNPDWRT